MDASTLLSHLRRELGFFRACLDGDLGTPVTTCGSWTLRDLAEHLGRENLWSAAAVTEGHGDLRAPRAPRERDALVRWFDETAATLLGALDTDPSTEAWTFCPPQHTAGFWQRRRCLETLVHRWDAEQALGTARPLDAELSGEGVSEVFGVFAPRLIARGLAAPPAAALRLVGTDTGASWTYGPGAPVAELAGTAERLLLLLWGRIPCEDAEFCWSGDRDAGLRVLRGPLVP